MARTPPPRRPPSPFDSDSDSEEELPDPQEVVRRIKEEAAKRRRRGATARAQGPETAPRKAAPRKKKLAIFTEDEIESSDEEEKEEDEEVTTTTRLHSPSKTKIVIFTSDEESDTENVAARTVTTTNRAAGKRIETPKKELAIFGTDSSEEEEEAEPRWEDNTRPHSSTETKAVFFTSDEGSEAGDVVATTTTARNSTTISRRSTTPARKKIEAPKKELAMFGTDSSQEESPRHEDSTRSHSTPKTKTVFFTSDEESEPENVPAADSDSSDEYVSAAENVEEEKEPSPPPPPQPEYQPPELPGTPEPTPKKLYIFTSDEESSPETTKRSKPKPRAGERRETGLEDMFSRTTISETPAMKKPARTPAKKSKWDPIFDSSSDDDSDPEAWKEFKTPAKPVRKTSKPSMFEDTISRHTEVEGEGASSDDLKKATITYPGFMKPLTPRRGPVEPKTPRKDGGSVGSPEKKLPRILSVHIPPTPYQENHDEFWDQETIDRWNDVHSPHKKPPRTPSKEIVFLSSDSESEGDSDDWIVNDDDRYRTPGKRTTKTPAKAPGTVARAAKKDWDARKNALAVQFVKDMDRKIEDGAAGKYYADKGGIKLEWNPKLRTTAGRALMNKGIIELSPKVITTEQRMYDTLAHEFAHLAVWSISRDKTDVHGPLFKHWNKAVKLAFPQHNITLGRTHSYEIEYKFEFKCQTPNCIYMWKTHSKPRDIENRRCPYCRTGCLLQTKPVPRATTGLSEYNRFTKANMARIKQQNPGSPMKQLMQIVGQEWKAHKAAQTPLRERSNASSNITSETQTKAAAGLEDLLDGLKL